ncbi:vomeronasal type-2 receptor 26-like [Leptodactylus fuscus]|uniref:vomeronasal type-2 receptor 26-like n=1 Tax=Leptodactylus fuscus TaxID=238119 RepID=UPI003F4E9C07
MFSWVEYFLCISVQGHNQRSSPGRQDLIPANVEEANRTPGMLPNLTLGAAVMDSCSEAKGAVGGTSWLLSGGQGGPMNYHCLGLPSRLTAVLGDAGGEAALSVANILGLYNYPQINYFMPPASLSNRFFFPTSLSVAPTLSSQAKGIVRLLEEFGWSWVGVLSQATSSALSQSFLEEMESSRVCLAFWENLPSESSTEDTLCTGREDLGTLKIFSNIGDLGVTYNVYKAVTMVVKTLKDMADCRQIGRALVGNHCADMANFNPWQLFFYLRRVRLKGNIGDDLYFDSLGNAPVIYDITNWQELSGVTYWVRVGSYESGAHLGQDLFINHSAIHWGGKFSQIPISVCSKECPPGFWKAPRLGQPHCCFDCIPCAIGSISNQTNAIDCFRCPEEKWPNSAHDQCIPREVELLSLSEPLGISLGSTSILGSFLPIFVLLLFIKYRETPLVRANNCTLSFILLVALTLSFLCPLLLLAPPGNQICLIRQASFGVLFTLCISCLLAKTVIVVLAFRAIQPGGCLKIPMGPRWPIFFAVFCTTIQFALCCSWFSVDPPFLEHDVKTQLGKVVIRCNYGLGFWVMLGYLGFLSTICFLVAFLARKLPGAFNEATYITFCMLVFLSVWICFVPAYLSTQGKLGVATEIFAILSSSAGLLFCIFTRKVYIILLKPQLNTRAMVSGQQRMETTINQRRRYPDRH